MSNSDFAWTESVSTTNEYYFIAVYLLVLLYCCFGLAVVCDVYFVPALQKLSYTYDLPPDIAGSTLMALGASVPELFASLIGVFITEDDIGTGSIIGSSCFNLIAVPAACAFVASASFSKKLSINPMPVIRNSAFYAITILVLLLIIKDNKVDILEAFILLLFFVMYMAFMIFCAQTKSLTDSLQSSLTSSCISTDSAIAGCNDSEKKARKINYHQENQHQHQHQFQHQHQPNSSLASPSAAAAAVYGQYHFAPGSHNIITHYDTINEKTPLVSAAAAAGKSQQLSIEIQIDEQRRSSSQNGLDQSVSLDFGIAIKNSTCLVKSHFADSSLDRLPGCDGNLKGISPDAEHEDNWVSSNWILIPMLPLTLGMRVLTPLKFKNTCWTIWTFLLSITLIGGLTYVSVWMVHLFGQTLGIPETVAGMTILSWGTGIPELIASIVLIKKTAQADMAICNTIGSNVIDVSFCLSLPWIVKCIINKTAGLDSEVEIQSKALPWTSFTLLVSVLLLILVLKLHDWVLSYSVGVWLLIVYVTFVIGATYLENNFSEKGLDLMEAF